MQSDPVSRDERPGEPGIEGAAREAAAPSAPVSGTAPVSMPVTMPRSAEDWVCLQLHREAIERYVPSGARVLQVNAGVGRFTETLHRRGCRVTALGTDATEHEAFAAQARERGFEGSIEAWLPRDVCHLEGLDDGAFDAVVAYGGALSFALERRDRALAECLRVLRPGGLLLASVLSLWGTMHRQLRLVLERDLVVVRGIIRSGNLPAGAREGGHSCHLFRAAELEAFLRRGGFELLLLSASSALSTGVPLPAGDDPAGLSALLEYERAACVERGYVDSGSYLIAVARR